MKSIKLVIALFVIACSVGLTLISANAKANVAPGANKKLIVCALQDTEGTTTAGNTCESGSNTCISHPCP